VKSTSIIPKTALESCRVGLALTGSFCTIPKVIELLDDLVKQVGDITPIFSENVANMDTKFGKAADTLRIMEEKTGNKAMKSINEAERTGPGKLFDIVLIAPCTGNTLSKLACGITDTSVTMASKAQLRNGRPLAIAISTNDGLGLSHKNLGILMNSKNVYFVPYSQDSPDTKPNSLVANLDLIIPTLDAALCGYQKQPILYKA